MSEENQQDQKNEAQGVPDETKKMVDEALNSLKEKGELPKMKTFAFILFLKDGSQRLQTIMAVHKSFALSQVRLMMDQMPLDLLNSISQAWVVETINQELVDMTSYMEQRNKVEEEIKQEVENTPVNVVLSTNAEQQVEQPENNSPPESKL